jgi:hypothetical protein
MKKGKLGDSSPISEDSHVGELPKFEQVGDRHIPIFPVSVLLDLARLVEQIRARQADADGSADSNEASPSASVDELRPKRKRSVQSDLKRKSASTNPPAAEPGTRPEHARPPRRRRGEQ